MDWSYFDRIVCINLYTRDDRYHTCQELFDKHKIPVEFYRTHKHPLGGAIGCLESHLTLLRNAYDKGYEKILIFEDDIIESGFLSPSSLGEAVEFMKTNQDWELFYLGITPEIWQHTAVHRKNHIYRLHSMAAHAYVIHRRLISKIMQYQEKTPITVAIDDFYVSNDHAYGICPSLFYQRPSESDLNQHSYNNSCVKLYWFRFLEFYMAWVNIPFLVVIPLLLLLVSLVIAFFVYFYSDI